MPLNVPPRYKPVFDFIGYGEVNSRFLFVGVNEHTPNGTEMSNLEIRLSGFQSPREDKNHALAHLTAGFLARGEHRVANVFAEAANPKSPFPWMSGKPGGVAVWTWAAMIRRAFRDAGACSDNGRWFRDWMHDYAHLGLIGKGADVLLADLFPLPAPRVTAWPLEYAAAFQCASADAFYQECWPLGHSSTRERTLRDGALDALPDGAVAIGYGRGGISGARFDRA